MVNFTIIDFLRKDEYLLVSGVPVPLKEGSTESNKKNKLGALCVFAVSLKTSAFYILIGLGV
jgi:hypothetical protein